MSTPTLRWARDDADGTPVWVGHSGAVPVASAWELPHVSRWGWCLFGVSAEARGHVPDLDAARAAAEAAWREWCASAGLVAAGGWRPIAEAPREEAAAVREIENGWFKRLHEFIDAIKDGQPPHVWQPLEARFRAYEAEYHAVVRALRERLDLRPDGMQPPAEVGGAVTRPAEAFARACADAAAMVAPYKGAAEVDAAPDVPVAGDPEHRQRLPAPEGCAGAPGGEGAPDAVSEAVPWAP